MKNKDYELDTLLWRHFCQTTPECNRIKNIICVRCEYLVGSKPMPLQNRYCTRPLRMNSAFTCIDHGYFKPKSYRTDPAKIQEEINEFVTNRCRDAALGKMWKEYRDRTDGSRCDADLSAPAYDPWEISNTEE